MESVNVVNAPKTATFQMRINPAVKRSAEQVFAECGLTMTDAINIFLQQSINVGGLPFIVTSETRATLREQAIGRLLAEVQAGRDSVKSESDWISEAEMRRHFGLEP